jgi:TonB family protein
MTEVPSTIDSQSGMPDARRLVIRIKIPRETPQAPVRRLSGRALLLIAGAAAVLLSWVGISIFRADPVSAPVATEATPNAESQSSTREPEPIEAAPVVSAQPLPQVAPETAPPSSINEVIPDVPRSARETIRGTIRVSIRVIVQQDGTVLAATADEPGPSRYFERLSLQASRKWTFAPADSPEPRAMLVRFYFKRSGTTARASPLQ